MYTKRENVDQLYNKTYEKFSQLGDMVSAKEVENFQKLLDDIAQKSNYKEGEMIMNPDLKEIVRRVNYVLDSVTNHMIESKDQMPADQRNNYDYFTPMITTVDHLFSMTMKTLGCPHMPVLFGEDIKEKLNVYSSKLNGYFKQEDYYRTSTKEHYQAQRKKNADEVRANNDTRLRSIMENKATVLDATKLVAEYQALRQRQDGHGMIWKLFHRKENLARNQLLTEMKEALFKFVGAEFKLDTANPTRFGMKVDYDRKLMELEKVYTDESMSKRYEMSPDSFAYEATTKERALADRTKRNRLFNKDPLSNRAEATKEQNKTEKDVETKISSQNKEVLPPSDKEPVFGDQTRVSLNLDHLFKNEKNVPLAPRVDEAPVKNDLTINK